MKASTAILKWIRAVGLCVLLAPVLWAEPPTEAENRMRELQAEIAYHDELYFKQAAPEITDAEYDRLKRELRELEADYPQFAAQVVGVGDDRTGDFAQASHAVPMLSLDKVYDEAELRRYLANAMKRLDADSAEWIVEPKYDGLAISLVYENGQLVRAVTRGNGKVGDEVTANVRRIKGVVEALTPSAPDRVELRGEIYLAYAEFERINTEREAAGLEPYAHPRNLAVGTLKQLDGESMEERRLSLVLYGWGDWEPVSTRPKSQTELYERLRDWRLPVIAAFKQASDVDEAWAAVQAFRQDRSDWPFPADGVVLKLNRVDQREKLGESTTAPNWAVAYKYPPDSAVTRITDIVLQVGRTGVLTPVAEFEPVTLGGATIRRASLHNRDQVERLDLRVGDWVEVEKAGEIIPQIARVLHDRREAELPNYVFPENCPVCGTALPQVEGEAVLRCANANCPARLKLGLAHFASKQGMDIAGMGPGLVERLIDAGLIKRPGDFYRLRTEQLEPVVGAKTAAKLIAAIAQSRKANLTQVITALGIPGIGPANAKLVAAHFKSLENLAEAEVFTIDPVSGPGLPPAVAEAMQAYLLEEENRLALEDLVNLEVGQKVDPAPSGPLAGKRFVLTGKLPGLTRREARELIQSAGGEVSATVSASTDFVVAGENAGTKLDEAKRRGIPVMDEAELRAKVKQEP